MCFTPTHPSLFWKMQDTFFHFRRIQLFVRPSMVVRPRPRTNHLSSIDHFNLCPRLRMSQSNDCPTDGIPDLGRYIKRGWSVVMSAVRLEFELSLLVMARPIRALYFNPHTFWFLPLISTTLSLSTLPAERICNQDQSLEKPIFYLFADILREIYNCPHFFIWVHGKTL